MDQRTNLLGHIAYEDLREWLELATRLGEVREVKGASWQEDIGLAAEAILRAENGPCVVLDEVPGCPKGFRLLLNMFAGKRRNMTFGFPEHLTKWELSDAYREAYLTEQKVIPHEMVDDGPYALVGWSDGAVIALRVAIRHPQLVRQLVLIGSAFTRAGEPARAQPCYLAAARKATVVYDHAQAERLYRAALDRLDSRPGPET